EKVYEHFNGTHEPNFEFESFFPGTFGYAHRIEVDGEFCGSVIVYPYFKDTSTSDEVNHVVQKMVECGISEGDAKEAVAKVKKFSGRFYSEMKELVGIVSDEVSTFHMEISKREA